MTVSMVIIRIKQAGKVQPNAAPILRYRPDWVSGMPIFRLIRALAWDIPKNLFHENPPLFKAIPQSTLTKGVVYRSIFRR